MPLLNSGRVVLPRNDRLIRQLTSLERTTARGSGRDNIDHPRGQHDDVANAVAGAAVLAGTFGDYNLDLLRRATALDDEDPTQKPPARPAIKNIETSLPRASSSSVAECAGHDENLKEAPCPSDKMMMTMTSSTRAAFYATVEE